MMCQACHALLELRVHMPVLTQDGATVAASPGGFWRTACAVASVTGNQGLTCLPASCCREHPIGDKSFQSYIRQRSETSTHSI